MFQRNGRSGYVLKPLALRTPDKELLSKRTSYCLEVTVSVHFRSVYDRDLNQLLVRLSPPNSCHGPRMRMVARS